MTLTEFLLARIAEDVAERVTRLREGYLPTPRELRETERWEAECEAKRRIVNDHERWSQRAGTDAVATSLGIRIALLHLTLPYADHPDYRDEWRP